MTDLTTNRQASGAERRNPWDGWRPRVANGALGGTNGTRATRLVRAYAVIAAFLAVVDVINILTTLQDAGWRGQTLSFWEPVVWEFSSGLGQVAACSVIYAALQQAPPGQGRWTWTIFVHASASIIFSALHSGLMDLVRLAVYASLGLSFHVRLTALPYEYRKDLIAYAVLGGIFWLFAKPQPKTDLTPEEHEAAPFSDPPLFDIVDGSRTLRTSTQDILSLRAAGNYVEFLLADGCKPLMRTSLREMEAVFAPMGFVRTHRSWIVNARRVRGLRRIGSGDFQIELDGAFEASLSRRFPDALARLRAKDFSG